MHYVDRASTADVRLPDGTIVRIPVITGILKHLARDRLAALLQRPEVLRKYTREALRIAGWPALRLFPRDWLLDTLPEADVPPARAAAIRFLLSDTGSRAEAESPVGQRAGHAIPSPRTMRERRS